MSLTRLAIGNVYGVIVLALTILVLGAVALASIPVDILPAFRTPGLGAGRGVWRVRQSDLDRLTQPQTQEQIPA